MPGSEAQRGKTERKSELVSLEMLGVSCQFRVTRSRPKSDVRMRAVSVGGPNSQMQCKASFAARMCSANPVHDGHAPFPAVWTLKNARPTVACEPWEYPRCS